MPEPTFVFDDDGNAYAYLNGKIVATASDVDQLEAKLAFDPMAPAPTDMQGAPPADDLAPPEGDPQQQQGDPDVQLALQVLEQKAPELLADQGQEPSAIGQADLPSAAPDTLPQPGMPPHETHVETPNGLKGQILGRVKGLWGDQVTIRLENGRIAKFDVTSDFKFTHEAKNTEASSPLQTLQARLEVSPDSTKAGLVARVAELKKIKAEAGALVRSRKVMASEVHELVVLADHELHEVNDALEAMTDAEPYAPPAPFNPGVVEQESVGRGESDWLDDTLGQMIDEAENTDFDQMIDEEPGVLVAELETPALEDAEGVQAYAAAHVASKTAGLNSDAVGDFTRAFLARVEAARRTELESREEEQTQQREAAIDDSGPDEGLFL